MEMELYGVVRQTVWTLGTKWEHSEGSVSAVSPSPLSISEARSLSAHEASLRLLIFLPQCWNCRCALLHPTKLSLLTETHNGICTAAPGMCEFRHVCTCVNSRMYAHVYVFTYICAHIL